MPGLGSTLAGIASKLLTSFGQKAVAGRSIGTMNTATGMATNETATYTVQVSMQGTKTYSPDSGSGFEYKLLIQSTTEYIPEIDDTITVSGVMFRLLSVMPLAVSETVAVYDCRGTM